MDLSLLSATAIVASLLVAIAMIAATAYLVMALRNVSKRLDSANERQRQRHAQALRQLDRIFKRRTGLSGDLIAAAIGELTGVDFGKKVDQYLQKLVDDLEVLFTEFTRDKCTISIKLLIYDEASGQSKVHTVFRDSDSAKYRENQYTQLEPFDITAHYFIESIVQNTPFNEYVACDDIVRECPQYRNPNPQWARLFNASAVYAICSPEKTESESIYGFLCIDNKRGFLNSDAVQALMSIVATSIFYVLSASMALANVKASRGK